MLRKLMFALFVAILVVGCASAKAADHEHVYGQTNRDYSMIEYASINDTYHQKITYTMKYCQICKAYPIKHCDETIVQQHSLIHDDYHNGDQPNHVYRTYCVYCDYQDVDLLDCDCPPGTWRRKQ